MRRPKVEINRFGISLTYELMSLAGSVLLARSTFVASPCAVISGYLSSESW